jgi:urease accessory protein
MTPMTGIAAMDMPRVKPDAIRALSWVLRTHDSFYPTGGYAHSMGLEGLVQAGTVRDVSSLRLFLRQLAIPSFCRTEAPLFAAAWKSLGQEGDPWPRLKELARLHHASRSPKELRLAGIRTGRQRLSMTAQAKPDGWCARLLPKFEEEAVPTSIAIAAALDARDGNVDLLSGATAFLYASLAGYISAAGKLLRLGQRAMQQELLTALETATEPLVAGLELPVEEAGWAVPAWDLFCCRHEDADHRLFLS